MSRRFRLSAVLRARQAQEDAARSQVVRARRTASDAAGVSGRHENTLHGGAGPSGGTGSAVVAALSARRSTAAALIAARRVFAQAEHQTTERMTELTDAAAARRSVEKLAERHRAAVRRRDQAADQRTIDELASTQRQRSAAQEVGR